MVERVGTGNSILKDLVFEEDENDEFLDELDEDE